MSDTLHNTLHFYEGQEVVYFCFCHSLVCIDLLVYSFASILYIMFDSIMILCYIHLLTIVSIEKEDFTSV